MIYCRIVESEDIWSFESKGHAVPNKNNLSISCAAVSVLVRSFGSVLAQNKEITVQAEKFQAGDIRIVVLKVNKNAQSWFKGVCDILIQGLSDAQRDFPDQIQFTIRAALKEPKENLVNE